MGIIASLLFVGGLIHEIQNTSLGCSECTRGYWIGHLEWWLADC